MSGWADIYGTLWRTALAEQLQYRAAMAIWLIGLIAQPVIYLAVWLAVAGAQGGVVGGFEAADFAAYYIVLMGVNHLTFSWNMFEFEFRVRTGAFSPLLLKPLHPIHQDIARNLSYKVLTLVVMGPAAALLAVLFAPRLEPPLWAVGLFVPALVLAFLMRFFAEWSLALAAFWTTRTGALNQVYFMASLFLAGRLAPLELLPSWLQTMATLSPFRWMVAFPVELLLGRLVLTEALWGLAAQAFWLAVCWGLVALVWRRGVRRYGAVGA